MKELKELTDKLKKTADEIRDKVDRLNARFDESPPEPTSYEPSEVEILEALDDWVDEMSSTPVAPITSLMAWLEAWKRGMRFNPTAEPPPTPKAPD